MSNETKNAPLKDKRALVVVGIVALAIAFVFLSGGNNETVVVDVAAKPIEIGSDPINDIGFKDRDAALTVFSKQIESLDQRMTISQREDATEKETLRSEMRDGTNALKAQIAALTDELISLRANGVDQSYTNANQNDRQQLPSMPDMLDGAGFPNGGLDFSGLDFGMSPPTPEASNNDNRNKSGSPYGNNYFVLRPAHAGVQFGPDGKPVEPQGTGLFNMSSPGATASSSSNSPTFTAINNGQNSNSSSGSQAQYASAAEAYEAQSKNAPDTITDSAGVKLKRITIPAFSFVEVTTLHGVACPVGANSPDNKGSSDIPARPVVLPVRGIFRGPNGSAEDVGNIHLMGLCSGRRTSSSTHGRATIRVEQMSYWDTDGDSQMSSSTGYIVDTRDNEQDVYGRLDKASGRTLALESAAAAGAAFSAALSQSEYTTQSNLNAEGGSNTVSQLTGDAMKAATSQGVAALFTNIAKRFENEANAAIDTVIVEPGIRLRFVTDQPIHVYQPAEAFDLSTGKSDVLL